MVAFEVTRIKGASEVAVAAAVAAAVEQLAAAHPLVQIREAFNTVDSVQDNYAGSMELLYEGAVLAILVVFWFLRDWRATLVAAVALPLSIIPTFAAMLWFGFSLNIADPAGHGPGGGHPGGRRHRRDREHRPPPAHGQAAHASGAWRRRTRSAWR